ncbi:alpha/beta fold hydrolase [Roseobacter sp. YSTF-M11]|uniref:Alpha/beta fold hydrolase n=1 Tax=Roseobacter insulae TaxID=2859783 RepID=A0A9X1FZT8_9RHOB|nr:alpha/beta fold hydrolase [Roseobacter insulae]MBW4710647.1 alpha/beta fold hydrolase [Roseobacter insulae]
MLKYSEFGGKNAPTVLIVHGLYGSGRNWGVIAKRLSDVAHVVTVDQRNHGHSDWTSTHTYDDMANDLAEVIEHIGGPVHVIGHSMGGKASMVLALQKPDLIRRLIVGDIAPVAYTHSQIQFIEAMRRVDLSKVTRRSDAEAQLGELGVDPALQSFFTQSLDVPEKRWRLNLDVLAAEMEKILSFPLIEGHFEGPVLFLSGAQSDYVSAQHRPTIKSLFPTARFAKLPKAGHWLHADNPRAFEAAVRTFLQMV